MGDSPSHKHYASYCGWDATFVLGPIHPDATPARPGNTARATKPVAPAQRRRDMPEYRILALDGGGVRGAFTSRLIERLEAATGLLAETDLVAGTSTGGIIALALG